MVATLRAGESERERTAIERANQLAAQVQSDARKHTKALLAARTEADKLLRENQQLTRRIEKLDGQRSSQE